MKKILFALLAAVLMFNAAVMSQTKPQQKAVKFVIHTDYGDMKGILYNETPQHRDNFVNLPNQASTMVPCFIVSSLAS